MSGSYFDASTTSADAAAIAAEVAPALGRNAQFQAQSATFITAHGAQVVAGHNDVGTGIVMDLEPPSPG